MTPENENEPTFGQRSPQSPPEAQPGATPWPQYGTVPGQPSGTPTVPQTPAAPQAPGYPQGGYAGAPQGGQGYQYTPAPIGNLPGRGGPIALIVFGVLTAVIIAPIALILSILNGLDFSSMMNGDLQPVRSGDVVTVDDSGTYLIAAESAGVTSCSLDNGDKVIGMQSPGNNSFFADNLKPGSYVLTCEGTASVQLYGVTGLQVDTLMNAGESGIMWGTIVGVIGLAMIIGGIVWLVSVNGKRKRLMGR